MIALLLSASAILLCRAFPAKTVRPFSLDMVVSMLGPAKALNPFSRIVIHRRSDGARAELRSVIPGDLTLFERKLSFTDGNAVTFYDHLRIKSTWPLENADERRDYVHNFSPRAHCNDSPAFKQPGSTTIFGQDVEIIQHTIPGRYRVTQWLAPELGCEQLQYESEVIGADGSFTLTAKGTVSTFTLGERDPKMFDPGLTFKEVKPSDAYKQLLDGISKRASVEEQMAISREGAAADRTYYMGDLTKPRWGGGMPAR